MKTKILFTALLLCVMSPVLSACSTDEAKTDTAENKGFFQKIQDYANEFIQEEFLVTSVAQSKEEKALIKQMKKAYKMTKVEKVRLTGGRYLYLLHGRGGIYSVCDATGEQIVPNANIPSKIYRIDIKDYDFPLIVAHIKGTHDSYFCDEEGRIINVVTGIVTWQENAHLWSWTPAFGSGDFGLLRYDGALLLPAEYSKIKFGTGTTKAVLQQKYNGTTPVYGGYDYREGQIEVPVLNYSVRYDATTDKWYTQRWEIDKEKLFTGNVEAPDEVFPYQGQYYYAQGDMNAAEQFFLSEPTSNPYRYVYLHHIYRKRHSEASSRLSKELTKAAKYTGLEGYDLLVMLNELQCDEIHNRKTAETYAQAYVRSSLKTYKEEMGAYVEKAKSSASANLQHDAQVKAKIMGVQESLMHMCIAKEKKAKDNVIEFEKKIAYENGLSKGLREDLKKCIKSNDAEGEKAARKKISDSDSRVADYKKKIVSEQRVARNYAEYYDLLLKFEYDNCK